MKEAPHILLVEDEPGLVMSLEWLLRRHGYRVGISRNGAEALAALQAAPYDLVLLDVRMPGVDGPEVCRYLRQHPARAATRVVFLSAERPPAAPPGPAASADLYVPRPFSPRQLVRQVQGLLGTG